MTTRNAEATQVHTRLMKCALEVEDARAYWRHAGAGAPQAAQVAFEAYWFGSRSLARIKVLLANLHARFDAYPEALAVLRTWPDMDPVTRALICHWHVMLSDPLYREFAGTFLAERREGHSRELTRDVVVRWVGEHGPDRWTTATRIQFASKLLSTAYAAGLVGGTRDPRPLTLPRLPDVALAYLAYLLRGVAYQGTLLDNPYHRSVGLPPQLAEERMRDLPGLRVRRMGDLLDFTWAFADLTQWARATLQAPEASSYGSYA
jgi:hypothetical protein